MLSLKLVVVEVKLRVFIIDGGRESESVFFRFLLRWGIFLEIVKICEEFFLNCNLNVSISGFLELKYIFLKIKIEFIVERVEKNEKFL